VIFSDIKKCWKDRPHRRRYQQPMLVAV